MNIKEFKPITNYSRDPVTDNVINRGVAIQEEKKQLELKLRRQEKVQTHHEIARNRFKKIGAGVLAVTALAGGVAVIDYGVKQEQKEQQIYQQQHEAGVAFTDDIPK